MAFVLLKQSTRKEVQSTVNSRWLWARWQLSVRSRQEVKKHLRFGRKATCYFTDNIYSTKNFKMHYPRCVCTCVCVTEGREFSQLKQNCLYFVFFIIRLTTCFALVLSHLQFTRYMSRTIQWLRCCVQIGISLVRFQMVSLEFFIDFLPIALWPWGRLSL